MKSLKAIIKDIKKLEYTDLEDYQENFYNDVVEAFGNYTYKKESYVIVNKDESNSTSNKIYYNAYIDADGSKILYIMLCNYKVIEIYIK